MSGNPQRTWEELVADGRVLAARVTEHRWRLGDLAIEVAPVGPHGGRVSLTVEAELRRYADEIAVDFKTLGNCRHVAAKWPTKSRRRDSMTSWSAHEALASLEDRADVIRSRPRWTVAAARDFVASRRDRQDRERPIFRPGDLAGQSCNVCGSPEKRMPNLNRKGAS